MISIFIVCLLVKFLPNIFDAAVGNVVALGPAAVNLRTSANYTILAKAGVTTKAPSVITGSIAVSPISSLSLVGFSLALASNGESATSSQVSGEVFAASYAAPTPATLTVAVGDMGTAFTDANGRPSPNFTNFDTGVLGNVTLVPGLYKWTTAVTIGGTVTISGASTDTWIFQVAGTLSVLAGQKVVLSGGALASNIVWVVTGAVSAAAGSQIAGVILGQTSITLLTGATANGRLLAQTNVALQQAIVN
ncbi:antifreeze protein [Mycena maculata]|uniref:Antifreeze protein n=1 Tax=Mycena maculata TaxID=230809 RepID=A0AAD7KHJ2_9AGAR|nr:antifreeze protein [Mycena maculata]